MSGPQGNPSEENLSVIKPFGASKPAYPAVEIRYSTGPGPVATSKIFHTGLTKREQFAAMIAQGLAPAYAQGGDFMEDHVAEGAVKVADALLRELAK